MKTRPSDRDLASAAAESDPVLPGLESGQNAARAAPEAATAASRPRGLPTHEILGSVAGAYARLPIARVGM